MDASREKLTACVLGQQMAWGYYVLVSKSDILSTDLAEGRRFHSFSFIAPLVSQSRATLLTARKSKLAPINSIYQLSDIKKLLGRQEEVSLTYLLLLAASCA